MTPDSPDSGVVQPDIFFDRCPMRKIDHPPSPLRRSNLAQLAAKSSDLRLRDYVANHDIDRNTCQIRKL